MNKKSQTPDEEITLIKQRLIAIEKERSLLLKRLDSLQQQKFENKPTEQPNKSAVNRHSLTSEKVSLFRSLFRGREDVFPRRWENYKSKKSGYSPSCNNEWVPGICEKPKIKCSECPNQSFIPVTEIIIRHHIMGFNPNESNLNGRKRDFTIGVYPLLQDETCWFLAIDFDKETWMLDAQAFLETCHQKKFQPH